MPQVKIDRAKWLAKEGLRPLKSGSTTNFFSLSQKGRTKAPPGDFLSESGNYLIHEIKNGEQNGLRTNVCKSSQNKKKDQNTNIKAKIPLYQKSGSQALQKQRLEAFKKKGEKQQVKTNKPHSEPHR